VDPLEDILKLIRETWYPNLKDGLDWHQVWIALEPIIKPLQAKRDTSYSPQTPVPFRINNRNLFLNQLIISQQYNKVSIIIHDPNLSPGYSYRGEASIEFLRALYDGVKTTTVFAGSVTSSRINAAANAIYSRSTRPSTIIASKGIMDSIKSKLTKFTI
jgi:hypothetical protein